MVVVGVEGGLKKLQNGYKVMAKKTTSFQMS
jgi:hypothetical protein